MMAAYTPSAFHLIDVLDRDGAAVPEIDSSWIASHDPTSSHVSMAFLPGICQESSRWRTTWRDRRADRDEVYFRNRGTIAVEDINQMKG